MTGGPTSRRAASAFAGPTAPDDRRQGRAAVEDAQVDRARARRPIGPAGAARSVLVLAAHAGRLGRMRQGPQDLADHPRAGGLRPHLERP